MHEKVQSITQKFIQFFIDNVPLNEGFASKMGEILLLFLFLAMAYIAFKAVLKLEQKILIPVLQKSKNKFDDLLIKHNFFTKIAYIVPALIISEYLPDILPSFPLITKAIVSILDVIFVIIVLSIIKSALDTLNDYYNRFNFSKDHPIKGLIQIIQMIVYLIGTIIIIGIIFNKDIGTLVLSLGTVSAVLMLIFKDPILGLVGGMQLIFNKMLSIGDWISMPKYGADGNVLEINLTTVKVQNWDKTIVTLPTYSLISDSFQNWKGMEESGGRRIKRAFFINMKSIKFCDQEMLDRFKKIDLIKDYIENTEKEIAKFNTENKINPGEIVNGRRQTNIGIFRAYLGEYLNARPDINKDLTFMVRQLEPSEKGIPIEVYVFAKTTKWVEYEGIQSDIFDHILASISEFELEVYQFLSDVK